jgi:hypothetical protein
MTTWREEAIYERMQRNAAIELLSTGMLVSQTDAAALLGIGKGTMSYHGRQGHDPQPIGRVGKTMLYWLPDVTTEALRRKAAQR